MENTCLKWRTLISLWFGVITGLLYFARLFSARPQDVDSRNNYCPVSIITVEIAVLWQISILGLYGIHKQKPLYLKMYVVVSVLTIAFWLTGIAFMTSTFGNNLIYLDQLEQSLKAGGSSSYYVRYTELLLQKFGEGVRAAHIWKGCFFMVLWIWIKSYFARVVNCYYANLKEELQKRPPSYLAACTILSK